MSSPIGPAAPGDVIAWRYRVDAWIGQGNMAAVYRATHLGTGQTCALKLVHAHLVERSEIRDLFVQEARVGARIGKNPHIVDVFDAGIDPQRGVPYLAMELLEGDTLDRYVKQRGPVPPGLLRMLYLQLADALGQAHAAGVVHRDLKPGNLFLTYDRKKAPLLKVVDFGIAKVVEEGVQGTATQVGSPAYAAPEQLGQAMRPMTERMGIVIAHSVSPATDIWALGVVAYELLIGAPPGQLWTGAARGSIADIMMGVAINSTPSASARAGDKGYLLPRGFDQWLERCLRKNAPERWQSVEEAVRALADLLDLGYDDGETQQINPHALLGIARKNSLERTLPIGAIQPPPEQAHAQTALLPPGLHPAATAPPPPQPQASPSASARRMNQRTALLEPSPALETTEPLAPPPPRPPQPFRPESPQSAATAIGIAGTKPPAPGTGKRSAGLVLGGLAFLGAMGLGVFMLMPKKGRLVVDVSNAGSTRVEVFVDGAKQCDAVPCILADVEPGTRTIKVLPEGGAPLPPQEAIVARGEEKSVMFSLAAKPPEASSTAAPAPPSPAPAEAPPMADLAGQISPTPAQNAPPLQVGPLPSTKPTSAAAAAPTQQNGTLNINSIPVSKVVLDGRPLGNTPKVGVSVPPGTHTVQFIHPEQGKKTVSVTIKPGETKTAAVKF